MALWAVCERITMVPCKIYEAIFVSVGISVSKRSVTITVSPKRTTWDHNSEVFKNLNILKMHHYTRN